MKVLLIGNSQTGVCNPGGAWTYDLARMIQAMSESAPADCPRIKASRTTAGGKNLKLKWEAGEGDGTPRAIISTGKWDYVIIQEIYSAGAQDFEKYADLFAGAARKAGAKPILFATASVTTNYSRACKYPDSFKTLNDMQLALGKKQNIPVAAAGYAWIRYLGPEPSDAQLLDMYHKDKGHPGYKGSYIYACLLYAVLTGKNPAGLARSFKDAGGGADIVIGADEAGRMQKAAWDQYLENKNQ
ncbi:MAG: hypothetical protein WC299_02175 [Kiritimatiellia bacterium]